jgi:hypothetical protein
MLDRSRGVEVTMSETRATCLAAGTAVEVCTRFPIGAEARALLDAGMSPQEFLDALIEKGELVDAVQFLAHAMPKREAVWWACRAAIETAPTGALQAALKAAEAWVIDPVEDRRVAAQLAAEAAGFDSPAGCAAAAAAWSGGSLAPPGAPVVPPGDHLTAHGASAAVMLAATSVPAETVPETYRGFLETGQSIARGEKHWPEPTASVISAIASARTCSRPAVPESGPSQACLKQPIRWE